MAFSFVLLLSPQPFIGVLRLGEALWTSLLVFAIAAFFYPDDYQLYFYYIVGLALAAQSVAAGMARADNACSVATAT